MKQGAIGRFIRKTEGLAAIEFAFLAPLMIILFFGTVELCNALICRQKVTTVAASASDLVAQDSSITGSQVSDIFSALNSIIYPYPSSGAAIIITSIKNDPNHAGQYVVDWSVAQNATPRSQGANMSVPSGLITSSGSVILAEITYTYTPVTTGFFTGPITMSDSFYSRPRKSLLVAYSP
ncbi:MAG TPA: TadE/TadG family type IV pilus assembly protein [Rhizomicrobium sp.]|jgi:Flp pilus assembly protein TadG